MFTDFSSILDKAILGEIERPKPIPVGSYSAVIRSIEHGETKSEKRTKYVRVLLELTGFLSDVNEVDLAEAGGWEKLNGKKLRLDFYITEDSTYRLQDFILKDVGLDLRGMSLSQGIAQLVNAQVGVHIAHNLDKKDPSKVYSEIDRTFNLNG